MLRQLFVLFLCAALVAGCAKTLTAEEKAQLEALRSELETTKREAVLAEADSAKYTGGLLQAMLKMRIEVLKTNQAILEQRINAIQSGAKVTVAALGTKPDPERAKHLEAELAKQEAKASEAELKASLQGGLVGAMAAMAAATERNTSAMLRQQYLVAKYGLGLPQAGNISSNNAAGISAKPVAQPAGASAPDENLAEQILSVTLLRKKFAEQEYQNYIFFDVTINAKGLDKPARAIKGALRLTDLFGEPQFTLRWTVDKPIQPGETITEKGSGFKFNQFMDKHQWVRDTEVQNMNAKFRVDEILYQDGTTRKFQ